MPKRSTIVCPNCQHVIEPRHKRKSNMTDAELRGWIESVVDHQSGPNEEDCWIWPFRQNHQGYGQIGFRGRSHHVHRVMYYLHYGDLACGLVVMHRNDCSKSCCNPAHLHLGTQKANVQESIRLGTFGGFGGAARDA